MQRTISYLTLESLFDLCRKASIAQKCIYEENERFYIYRNFDYLSWYSRIHILHMPQKNVKRLERLKDLCLESASPKYLSFVKNDVYAGIENDLTACGFLAEKQQAGMIYNLGATPTGKDGGSIIAITEETIGEWLDVCREGFHKPLPVSDIPLFLKDADCHFYGYTLDGKIVSTALLNICGKNGGIHEVTTLAQHRGKGYSTALITHIMNEAIRFGCRVLTLQASASGEPVYERLGFQAVNQILHYRYNSSFFSKPGCIAPRIL